MLDIIHYWYEGSVSPPIPWHRAARLGGGLRRAVSSSVLWVFFIICFIVLWMLFLLKHERFYVCWSKILQNHLWKIPSENTQRREHWKLLPDSPINVTH